MSARILLALLGLACVPAFGLGQSESTAAPLVAVTYNVADLVVPIGAGDPKAPGTKEKELMSLVRGTVAPASWEEKGGPGRIDYHAIGMALVVRQTRPVQQEVAELLAAL